MRDLNDVSRYKDLAVFECGKEDCVKSKAISFTKKTYHLFHYVVSGKGTFIIENKQFQINPGTIFFIPKGYTSIYYADKENPWTYIWVGFDGEVVEDYLSSIGLSISNPIILDPSRKLKKYFDLISSRYLTDGYIDISSLGALYQLFGELLFNKVETKKVSSGQVTLQLARDYINNNYQFDISVTDIAKNANVTPNYLSSIFQKELGISTKQYLIKLRMEKAVDFLKSGFFNVKQVSEMVGYPNQLHFSNEFKRIYGKSPINFIKKEENNEE